MLQYTIPGYGELNLTHLVMDYNGTLAVDGALIPGVKDRLFALSDKVALHVITADTFGLAQTSLAEIPVQLDILAPENQDTAKLHYVRRLGAEHTVAMGNGRNDRFMLNAAALGIALVLSEGAAAATLAAADIVCTGVKDALDLLLNPKRLTATLRC
ncbi:MAG: ATPase P [Desulfatitalea sp.]|nr:ATPase P [Desulfatitalea sp.]NNJ99798.1 ATPase P [Desulfatitalea sp.]